MGSSFSMTAMTAITGGGTSPEDICAICTEAGPDKDTGLEQVLICPNDHYAHVDCVSLWYAKSDKCPECRVNVRSFPLWQNINPPEPEPEPEAILQDLQDLQRMEIQESDSYNFRDPGQLFSSNRRFMNMRNQNDYYIALEYFYSPEGDAYVRHLIDEDMRQYEYLINVQEEDPENVNMTSLMFKLTGLSYMNVANALHNYALRSDLLQDLRYSSGPIINKFVNEFNDYQHIVQWLWSRGFRAGFGFLENAALEARNVNAVKWYLTHIEPSRNDEKLIELFNTVRSDTSNQQNAIYNALDNYINGIMQVEQTGGMWQSGGFFMTCS
jgi:hypothetical protein